VDWTFIGCAFLAVVIALSFSSIELLTKYQSRSLREIFLSWYYLWFALLNALFCFLVYLALPFIEVGLKFGSNSNPVSLGEQPLLRAIVAGFGYLVIARMSLLDIKTSTGEPIGVGFDAIYNTVAKYLLNFHEKQLKDQIRKEFFKVYQKDPADAPIVFLNTVNFLITEGSTADEEKSLRDELRRVRDQPAMEYCSYLYQLIRDRSTTAKVATDHIENHRDILKNNAPRAAELRQELSWLFPAYAVATFTAPRNPP
jgi:hypothetical protein